MRIPSPKIVVWIVVGLIVVGGSGLGATRLKNVEADLAWLNNFYEVRRSFAPKNTTAVGALLECLPDWTFCNSEKGAACSGDLPLSKSVLKTREWWAVYPWASLETLQTDMPSDEFEPMLSQFRFLAEEMRDTASHEDPCRRIAKGGTAERLRVTLIYLGLDRLDLLYQMEMYSRGAWPESMSPPISIRDDILKVQKAVSGLVVTLTYHAVSYRIAGTCLLAEKEPGLQSICENQLALDDSAIDAVYRYRDYLEEELVALAKFKEEIRSKSSGASDAQLAESLKWILGDSLYRMAEKSQRIIATDMPIMGDRIHRLEQSSVPEREFDQTTLDEEERFGSLLKYAAAVSG